VAGSLCGKGMSSKASTTIGFERRFNPMLSIDAVDRFVAESAGIGAPKPPNLERIVALNRGPWVGSPAPLEERAAPAADAQLLDVRPLEQFLAGHRHGALGVPLRGSSFAIKAGFVLDPTRPVTVVASSRDEAERAARGLRSVGFLDLDGFLHGGGAEQLDAVSLDELEGIVERDEAVVLDVREPEEVAAGTVPGALNIPYRLLPTASDIPAGRPLVTVCETGPRAAVAAGVLQARGFDARPVAYGGVNDWLARERTVAVTTPPA
jgi:rhodanese-related sulfurtransferase